jgi:hypothetical protein
MATPITFLVRQVLERCPDYDAAFRALRDTPIASDALLMVTGTRAGEMAVIERTPTRAAVREAEKGVLVLTNDYRLMDDGLKAAAVDGNELQVTACARFDRAQHLARASLEASVDGALGWLADQGVAMGITVQHVAMQAATGTLEVRIPGASVR